jgi:hypothetical protein
MKKLLKLSLIPIATYLTYFLLKKFIRNSLKNNFEIKQGKFTVIQFYKANYYRYGDLLFFLSYFTMTSKNKLFYLTFKPKDFKRMHSIVIKHKFESLIRKHGESIVSFSSENDLNVVKEDLLSYISKLNPIILPIRKNKYIKIKEI